ncbi:Crp/Fnr family transcriptional regulator [Aquisalimonas sp.]|uniref:Crp/Fnr family transcriptional regulator n=1 Tax=Aquisalimonas sp. TaxID=1872621 RepID=UPI0025C4F26C|nr:Crp/Fnr family transcriptional regulator [Aquisalimonas sp.]
MSRTRPVAAQPQVYHTENRLLAAMSPALAARLFPAMEQVSMTRGTVINESGVTQNHVYFPANAIVSLLYVLEDGASAETSMVGNDGMVGVSLVMGGGGTPSRAVVLIPGVGFRLPAQVLRRELEHHPELMRLLLRYIQTLMTQMAQTAVCYRHHSLRQQLCGLLLLTLDRLPSNTVAITHELIAHMLGVRREGVTEAAVQLQKAGVIRYSRGQIEVIDRPRLEEMACECYGVVKKECDRIMSLPL